MDAVADFGLDPHGVSWLGRIGKWGRDKSDKGSGKGGGGHGGMPMSADDPEISML